MAQEMTWMSLAGSVFSTACTAYFWLVRSRRERPNLASHLLEHEFFLGQGRVETRTIGFQLAVVLANNSILPNAVIGARVWLRTADGNWESVDGLTTDQRMRAAITWRLPCAAPRPARSPSARPA